MAICHFFIQGRCRFGEKCWNEHPRDGHRHAQGRYQQQQLPPPAGSTTWIAPGHKYAQPSGSSKSTTWTNRDNDKASFGHFTGDRNRNLKQSASSGFFTTQNSYSVLATKDHTKDHAQDSQTDRDRTLLEDLLLDMDIWETSGQWLFSVYSSSKDKCNLSGFTDISPEELRLECYESQKQGQVQSYVNSVQQLVSQWKGRVHEIKNLNPATKSALLNELNKPSTDPTPTFGGLQNSVFGSPTLPTSSAVPSVSTFSFKPDATNTGPNADSSSTFSNAAAFGSKPAVGFGNAMSAASFSFAASTHSGVGASSFPGFGSAPAAPGLPSGFGGMPGSTDTTVTTGFGSSASAASAFGGATNSSAFGGFADTSRTSTFGAQTTAVSDLFKAGAVSSAHTAPLFGQASAVSVSGTAVSTSPPDMISTNTSFTLQADLSPEDLLQFTAKQFTLGKIPLLPPPADLLNV